MKQAAESGGSSLEKKYTAIEVIDPQRNTVRVRKLPPKINMASYRTSQTDILPTLHEISSVTEDKEVKIHRI
jgi:hypothetical protein